MSRYFLGTARITTFPAVLTTVVRFRIRIWRVHLGLVGALEEWGCKSGLIILLVYNYTTTSVFSFFTSSLMPPPLLLVFIVVLESCSHDCHEIELAADALKPAHTPENNGFFVLLCAEQHKNFIGIIKLLEQTSSSRGKDHHITWTSAILMVLTAEILMKWVCIMNADVHDTRLTYRRHCSDPLAAGCCLISLVFF